MLRRMSKFSSISRPSVSASPARSASRPAGRERAKCCIAATTGLSPRSNRSRMLLWNTSVGSLSASW